MLWPCSRGKTSQNRQILTKTPMEVRGVLERRGKGFLLRCVSAFFTATGVLHQQWLGVGEEHQMASSNAFFWEQVSQYDNWETQNIKSCSRN
jgi:hypothetical protein